MHSRTPLTRHDAEGVDEYAWICRGPCLRFPAVARQMQQASRPNTVHLQGCDQALCGTLHRYAAVVL